MSSVFSMRTNLAVHSGASVPRPAAAISLSATSRSSACWYQSRSRDALSLHGYGVGAVRSASPHPAQLGVARGMVLGSIGPKGGLEGSVWSLVYISARFSPETDSSTVGCRPGIASGVC